MGRICLPPPDVGDVERDALLRDFDSNWITRLCPGVDSFEVEFAVFTGSPAAALSTWQSMHHQPVFADAKCHGGATAEDLNKRGICLPSSSAMTEADVERVAIAVRDLLRG